MTYLARARAMGASLLVALNRDASARRLGKGGERPLNGLQDRLAVVAALESVSAATWFEEDTPEALIRACRPDVLVKGGDWPVERIAGAAEVLHFSFESEEEDRDYDGQPGAWGFHKNGNGGFTQVLARSAEAFGAEIRLESPVDHVVTKEGRATGVVLEDGTDAAVAGALFVALLVADGNGENVVGHRLGPPCLR